MKDRRGCATLWDGRPGNPQFAMPFPEPQSMGSQLGSEAVADWVLVQVVP